MPPYQTVIYWPGGAAQFFDSIDEYSRYMDFIVKSGRAVAFPVYKGTFERGDRTPSAARRHAGLSRQRDPGRERLAPVDRLPRVALRISIRIRSRYFGHSWGGSDAGDVLAQEPRIATAIIYVGFFCRRLNHAARGRSGQRAAARATSRC